MRIHFIAIGGSAMHNLALALHDQGHHITGSDDEIYEPSRSRLDKEGLLPKVMGWHDENITDDLDAVILGMHARTNNPELLKAQESGVAIYSYPEFVALQSKEKIRVVIAGSHGKTTTTSLVLNALNKAGVDHDYLVGAQLEGYDRMVKLSDAPIIILEGDEYLSSPIDRRPKMLHYNPSIAVITGIAWDHINVFPTFQNYVEQFKLFVNKMSEEDSLFYYANDENLHKIANNSVKCSATPYDKMEVNDKGNIIYDNKEYPLHLIGNHNLQNICAAMNVCASLGVDNHDFLSSLEFFEGPKKRLQVLHKTNSTKGKVFLDFAHAPSKVKATVAAVKDWYGDAPLVVVLELHTFSSLNKDFIPLYKDALQKADKAAVMYSPHAMKMKKMPSLDADFVKGCFGYEGLEIIHTAQDMHTFLDDVTLVDVNLLLMSSGTFDGYDLGVL